MHLKHHLRLILSLTGLSVGALILFVSLSRSATTVLSSTGQYEASRSQLYMDSEILPDHVLYPVLMTVDRVKLESASPTDRVYMQIEYGQRRMDYAEALLKKDNAALALTTATKAQKYFIHAAQETLDNPLSETIKTQLTKSLAFQQDELRQLKDQFPTDQDKAALDQLHQEGQALLERLRK